VMYATTAVRRTGSLIVLSLIVAVCGRGQSQPSEVEAQGSFGSSVAIGGVIMQGKDATPLHAFAHRTGFTNGTDTFFTKRLNDGGAFVLYRYTPSRPTLTASPYPEILVPGTSVQYVKPIPQSPFYEAQTVTPPFAFATPFSEFKWPALISDSGVGIFLVAESPVLEEAIEPFVSAYPTLGLAQDSADRLRLRFDEGESEPKAVTLVWDEVDHTAASTTYVAPILDASVRSIAIRLHDPETAERVWYRTGDDWKAAVKEYGGPRDPDLLIIHAEEPKAILIETKSGLPDEHATTYSDTVGYVDEARWAAFTIYDHQAADSFFSLSMIPSMEAYDDSLFALRDRAGVRRFPDTWRELLERVGFTPGKNLLNPEFFDRGFPAAGDPAYQIDDKLKVSVSWVSDESALQAVMGARLFDFPINRRYAESVRVFYEPRTSFYYGSFLRDTGKFTSADTGSDDRVIGYNYLLSLMRLTELIGTPVGLPAADVQKLVDRALPTLQAGYVDGYPQVGYLWGYPNIEEIVQSEYGMGRELSEAQLSYICGLWWLRTHEPRYRRCQEDGLRLPERFAFTLHGSSYLWGLDVVHGAYVTDALLLAYHTTGERHYLDAALNGWREELLFLFSSQDYPETPFDDRAMAVTSFYSAYADLNQGNSWRGDAWNNVRTMWSLSKLLAYVDDPRISFQLDMARETHKQTMPVVDQVFNPLQRSDYYYNATIERRNYELNYEGLVQHYSTQIAYSNDVWREAFLFDSIISPDATVYRIPGTIPSDPGLAYVRGAAGARVHMTIDAADCTFRDGRVTATVRLNASGIARVPLRPASA
jgi:hypothetical protein